VLFGMFSLLGTNGRFGHVRSTLIITRPNPHQPHYLLSPSLANSSALARRRRRCRTFPAPGPAPPALRPHPHPPPSPAQPRRRPPRLRALQVADDQLRARRDVRNRAALHEREAVPAHEAGRDPAQESHGLRGVRARGVLHLLEVRLDDLRAGQGRLHAQLRADALLLGARGVDRERHRLYVSRPEP
jgi:hypothetical protein